MRRRRKRWVLAAALILSALFLVQTTFRVRVNPLLEELASASVSDAASNLMNDAIDREIELGNLDYENLVTLQRDETGAVTALTTNMQTINRLKTGLLARLDREIPEISSKEISVPCGNLTGIALLSGRGPSVPVKVISVSSSDADFSGVFESAGINQTIHRIMLRISLEVVILLPNGAATTRAETEVCVAETVLLGRVPESFSYYNGTNVRPFFENP